MAALRQGVAEAVAFGNAEALVPVVTARLVPVVGVPAAPLLNTKLGPTPLAAWHVVVRQTGLAVLAATTVRA